MLHLLWCDFIWGPLFLISCYECSLMLITAVQSRQSVLLIRDKINTVYRTLDWSGWAAVLCWWTGIRLLCGFPGVWQADAQGGECRVFWVGEAICLFFKHSVATLAAERLEWAVYCPLGLVQTTKLLLWFACISHILFHWEIENRVTYYRIKPLFLVQELSKILWGCTQHALLLKVLDSSLWFLVEPV